MGKYKPYDDGSKIGSLDQPWGQALTNGIIVACQLSWNSRLMGFAAGGINCSIGDLCRYGNAMAPAIIKTGSYTPLGQTYVTRPKNFQKTLHIFRF